VLLVNCDLEITVGTLSGAAVDDRNEELFIATIKPQNPYAGKKVSSLLQYNVRNGTEEKTFEPRPAKRFGAGVTAYIDRGNKIAFVLMPEAA
jgi:hypothetical protein